MAYSSIRIFATRRRTVDSGSDFIPTISTTDELNRLNKASEAQSTLTQVHIKIDTGMGRMGIWHEEALEFLR